MKDKQSRNNYHLRTKLKTQTLVSFIGVKANLWSCQVEPADIKWRFSEWSINASAIAN